MSAHENDSIDFFDELSVLVDRPDMGQAIFGLQNSEKVLVKNLGDLFLGRQTVIIYEEEGAVVTFPFASICSAQVLPLKE